MSNNSPYGFPGNDPLNKPTPAGQSSDFDYAGVPSYGSSPVVQPTGKTSTFSIVGFVLSILMPLIGLVLSIIAYKQAGETGDNKGLAKAGIIVGSVLMALNVIISIFMVIAVAAAPETVTTY